MKDFSRDHLINHLWEDTRFAELTSNRDRVLYVLKNLLPFEKLQEFVKANLVRAKTKAGKSLISAKNFNTEADLLAKRADVEGDQGLWELALQAYTKAILFTPKSEPRLLAKLYARKSQAHSKKGETEAALWSIGTAIEISESHSLAPIKLEYAILRISALKTCGRYREALAYLDQLLEKQNQRICECNPTVTEQDLRHIKQGLQQSILTQVLEEKPKSDSLSEQEYFSYKIDSRCKIKASPVVGRHFVATGDILGKETLLEERPYCIILSPEFIEIKCSNCYAELGHRFYPCGLCTEAIYCDQKCATQAYDTYHRFECGLISELFAISSSQSVHVYRMIAFAGGPIRAYEAQRWLQETSYSIDDYLSEPSQRVRRELEKTSDEKIRAYALASSLISHDAIQLTHTEAVYQTVASLEIAALLDQIYDFRSKEPSMDFFIDLVIMLNADLRRIVFNVFGWQDWANEEQSKLSHVAQAQCLVGSLINHSCVPNVTWGFSEQGVMQFVANRPIKAGEEITISYGTYRSQNYLIRQKRLNNYYFACACNACYSDARKGTVLSCKSCSGPVPYDQPVNKVAQLSGKCLLCFDRYDKFDEAIDQLDKAKVALNAIQGMVIVSRSGPLVKQAVNLMRTVEKLSLTSSDQVQQAIVVCSKIIEAVGADQFEATFAVDERLELALFMQRHLSNYLTLSQEQTKLNISTLQFWFDRLLSLIAVFSQNSTRFNAYESELWSATFAIHDSLKTSFDRIASDAPTTEFCTEVMASLIRSQIESNERTLKQSLVNYGRGRLLLNGQDVL